MKWHWCYSISGLNSIWRSDLSFIWIYNKQKYIAMSKSIKFTECLFKLPNLGWKRVERVVLLEKKTWDSFQVFETVNVLQDYQQVPVGHHEGRGQHGVPPPIPHHPQHARPDEEDKRQPADVRDAPRLRRRNHEKFQDEQDKVLCNKSGFLSDSICSWKTVNMYMNGQRNTCCLN